MSHLVLRPPIRLKIESVRSWCSSFSKNLTSGFMPIVKLHVTCHFASHFLLCDTANGLDMCKQHGNHFHLGCMKDDIEKGQKGVK